MKLPSDDWFRKQARSLCQRHGVDDSDIQMDDKAPVSHGDEKYSWVQAWITVPWPEQPECES